MGVEVFLDTDGVAQLEGTRTVVKSPGVPREALVIAAALVGEVVLLSPARASFDAFENFEARGERFRQIVGELAR